jgi:hypothetical protein
MRKALCLAIGLAAIVGGVPPSFAQDSQVLGESSGTASGAKDRQANDELSHGLRLEARGHSGISLAVPVGRVWVRPEALDGEPIYVRRTTEATTIVEVSTTPFTPVLASNGAGGAGGYIVRPDQPASW